MLVHPLWTRRWPSTTPHLRAFVAAGVAILVALAWPVAASAAATDRPLRHLAAVRRLAVGSAAAYPGLTTDPAYAATLAREFSMLTPENELKWGPVHPERDRYDFAAADALVDFARRHRMRIRGHTLVWYQQNPAWLTGGTFTRDESIAVLREHIHAVVGRYRGRIRQWDVVNEAFQDLNGALRDTIWLQRIGPEYVELAFRFAHEADPHAKLYYNDFLTELIGPKLDAVVALVADLKARGVPIHGVGFQAHAFVGGTSCPGCFDGMRAGLQRIADLGLDVALTELDVMIPQPTTPAALTTQADMYRTALDACLAVRRCRSFVVWGFTDRRSWIPAFFPGYDDALLFDRNLVPKPAYDAVAERLRQPR